MSVTKGKLVASFEAFTVVMFQVEVFWVVTSYSAVVGYHHFRGSHFLCIQGEDGGSMDL
jgi:hypothetical protein